MPKRNAFIKKRIGFIDATGQYPIPGEHKDVAVHITDFDYIVACDTEPMDIPAAPPTAVDKQIAKVEKVARSGGDKEAKRLHEVLVKVQKVLDEGRPARVADLYDEERELLKPFFLLTMKPTIGDEWRITSARRVWSSAAPSPYWSTSRVRRFARAASSRARKCARPDLVATHAAASWRPLASV